MFHKERVAYQLLCAQQSLGALCCNPCTCRRPWRSPPQFHQGRVLQQKSAHAAMQQPLDNLCTCRCPSEWCIWTAAWQVLEAAQVLIVARSTTMTLSLRPQRRSQALPCHECTSCIALGTLTSSCTLSSLHPTACPFRTASEVEYSRALHGSPSSLAAV